MKSVRQRQKNIAIFNVEFQNVEKRRKNCVKMTISKKSQKKKKKKNSNRIHGI